MSKEEIRQKIWDLMERLNIAKFPRPVHGRIPNFIGAEEATERILAFEQFKKARTIKVNPDSPQKPIRKLVLSKRKQLLMPTPRLKKGFLLLDPLKIPKHMLEFTSSIKGAFRFGEPISLKEMPSVDLIVIGSVAVSLDGARIGKGHGYSEFEYGILRELKLIDETVPVFTTVHDVQIVDSIPIEEYDVPVDFILTPTRTIGVKGIYEKPKGIFWEKVTLKLIEEIPILKELKYLKSA